MQNLSNENEFDLHQNEPLGGTPFHIHEWFLTKTCFDTEAKDNPEKADYLYFPFHSIYMYMYNFNILH